MLGKQEYQMKQAFRLRLNFKRQFFVFFLCSSVFPLVIFSILFLSKTQHILSLRNTELLRISLLLADELTIDALDKLALSADTLSSTVLEEGLIAARLTQPSNPNQQRHNQEVVRQTLQTAIPDQYQDILVLFDANGYPVADTLADNATRSRCLPTLSRELALKAPNTSPIRGILRADGCLPHPATLLLGNLRPLLITSRLNSSLEGARPTTVGFLFWGRDIRTIAHSHRLNRLPHEISIRFFRSKHKQLTPLASSDTGMAAIIPSIALLERHQDKPHLFAESIPTPISSMVESIEDVHGRIQGYIVASLPRDYWGELINEDTAYLIISFLMAMGLVFLLGQRFNRAFVIPMQALSAATHAIANGDLTTQLETHSDDEEIRRTLQDFNKMIDHLREKEDLRQNFTATLTHDLRTPLIAQKRTLEFFQSYVAQQLDEQSARLLNGLSTSNDDLLDMINHLLETFNYESGKITLHHEAIGLRALVETCIQTVQSLAQINHIQVNNNIADDVVIQADPKQIKRVLLNLLGNSIQNLAAGDTVSVSTESDATNQRDTIVVNDTGPGLDEKLLDHIFDRYPTISGRQQRIGSGLGLFICRMIVELHGGTISVSSVPQQGTCFRIHLPKTPFSVPETPAHSSNIPLK
jgi:signal transduction histidine kinase